MNTTIGVRPVDLAAVLERELTGVEEGIARYLELPYGHRMRRPGLRVLRQRQYALNRKLRYLMAFVSDEDMEEHDPELVTLLRQASLTPRPLRELEAVAR